MSMDASLRILVFWVYQTLLETTVGVVGAARWGFAVGVFVATAFLHTSCRIFGSDSSTSQAMHSDMRKIQKDNYSTHEGFGWVSNVSNSTNSCSRKSRKGRVADQDSPWHCGCHQHLHSDANDASVQPLKLHIGPCFVNIMSIWWCFHHLFEGPNTCIMDIGCYLKVRFSVRTWTPQVQLQYEHVSNPFHQKSICNTPRWVITASQQISSSKPSQGGHTSKEVRNLVDESRCLEIQLNDRTKNEAPQKKQMIKRSKSNSAVLDGSGFVTHAGYRIRWIHSLLLGFDGAADNCSMPCIRSFERWRPESTPKNDLQNWDTTGRSNGLFQCAVESTLCIARVDMYIYIYFMSYHLWLPVLQIIV